jgi:hypothetical protein
MPQSFDLHGTVSKSWPNAAIKIASASRMLRERFVVEAFCVQDLAVPAPTWRRPAPSAKPLRYHCRF